MNKRDLRNSLVNCLSLELTKINETFVTQYSATHHCLCRWAVQAVSDQEDAHAGEQILANLLVCGESGTDCTCEPAALQEFAPRQLSTVSHCYNSANQIFSQSASQLFSINSH